MNGFIWHNIFPAFMREREREREEGGVDKLYSC